MKFTIGTASSNMEFTEDLKLIKSSLLYADEVELIGMAEYAIYHYLPRCMSTSNELDVIIENLIPFMDSFDNDEAKQLADQIRMVQSSLIPCIPIVKKNKNRSKQELLAQFQYKKVEKQCKEMLDNGLNTLMSASGTNEIKKLIDRKIITVYDYSFKNMDFDELTGGYFANLLGTIKHGTSYPLFDNISSDLLRAAVDSKFLDFGQTDKEIVRHAGVAKNIMMTLPTLDKASVDEILDFKKDLKVPLDNFRAAIYSFSEQISTMPWDEDFKYECIKLYDTQVIPKVNELNQLSSETSVLKNFGSRVLADEEERRKLGFIGAGLLTTITTGTNIANALGVLENIIRSGAKIGLTASAVSAFLKTADLLNQAHKEVKIKEEEIQGNVMYYYYRASKDLGI